jgi:hypothetical protein
MQTYRIGGLVFHPWWIVSVQQSSGYVHVYSTAAAVVVEVLAAVAAADEYLHEVSMPPPSHLLLHSMCWLVSESHPVLHETTEDNLDRLLEPTALP